MLSFRGNATEITGLSLGAKFVGLTAGLILLLSLTALISLRRSAETALQFQTVVDYAIPAYGALARSHIRSLEQAVALRRALIVAADPAGSDKAITDHIRLFTAAQDEFHRELADAEGLLEKERESASSRAVAADLQKLANAVVELRSLIEIYEEEAAACLAAVRARSLPQARQRLVTVDSLRNELGQRLENARAQTFAILKTISEDTQAAQARAQMATIVVFVLASILGLCVAAIGAARLIRSIKYLVRGAEAVEGGNLDTRIEIRSS